MQSNRCPSNKKTNRTLDPYVHRMILQISKTVCAVHILNKQIIILALFHFPVQSITYCRHIHEAGSNELWH